MTRLARSSAQATIETTNSDLTGPHATLSRAEETNR